MFQVFEGVVFAEACVLVVWQMILRLSLALDALQDGE